MLRGWESIFRQELVVKKQNRIYDRNKRFQQVPVWVAGSPAKNQWDEMRELDISHGKPVEFKAGECMFHHCLNFHATPPNITDRQRRAFIMIFMAEGVCYNKAQSPNHVLVPGIEVEDGQPLIGSRFPVA